MATAAANAAAAAAAAAVADNVELRARLTQLEGLLGAEGQKQADAEVRLAVLTAQNMIPQNLSEAMNKKIAFAKEAFTRSRVAFNLLAKEDLKPSDITEAKKLIGEIYRMANNELAGADFSRQVSADSSQSVRHQARSRQLET